MKIDLSLIKTALAKQRRTQTEFANYMGINKSTMVSIFKKNDCSIKQFEKMVEFFSCSGEDVTSFIIFNNPNRHLVSALNDEITPREYISRILDDLSRMRRELRDQDILRKALVDKDEIIKLLKEKL